MAPKALLHCKRCRNGFLVVGDEAGNVRCIICGCWVYAPPPDISVTEEERQSWMRRAAGYLPPVEQQKRRRARVLRAAELLDAGLSLEAVASELGVSLKVARQYTE